MNTKPLGPFAGLNNRLPDFALGATREHAAFLRRAENVDVDNSGHLRMRAAGVRLQAVSGAHSLSPDGAYLVRASSLYAVTLPSYSETLVKVLTSDARMSWLEFNGDLYYSNGTDSGRISSGVWYPLALPTPDSPACAAITGTLFVGKYQIAVSYYNATTGEESGVSPSSNYELVTDGGWRVTLPAATPGATHVNVYVSTVNGSVPRYHGAVAVGTATYDITTVATGREAFQRYEAPLPAGRLFWFNGRLCSYKDNTVYEGLPFRPGYYLPSEGGIPFPAAVSNCVPAQDGCYIVADKTYFIQGQRLQAEQGDVMDVLPYGGVYGTEFVSPNKTVYGWFGAKGIVLAKPSGEVEAVMSDNIDVTVPASGVSAVFEDRGYRRVVSCGYCLNLDNLAVTTYTDYDYTSFADNYATKADGIYDVSAAGNVSWEVGLGKQNFGTEQLKLMPAIYLGCASSSPLQVRITTPSADYSYPARTCSDEIKEHRVDPGKGLRSNWFDVTVFEQIDFTLATVSFAPAATSRRI